jgi:hypothetical protein
MAATAALILVATTAEFTMPTRIVLAALLAAGLVSLSPALAHETAGNRFFPATLTVDDPGVNDELAFPTVSTMKNGDTPSAPETGVSAEFAKRITDDFAIAVAPSWVNVSPPGGPFKKGASGFENLETSFKYRLFKNVEHEFVLSAGLEIEWGRTGAANIGAESFNVYTPTVFFGKGFGDLPDSLSMLRPFAVTGVVGYGLPAIGSVEGEFIPRTLEWGGSLQYSMPYLKSAVRDYGLPDFINHLVPIVEFAMSTQIRNTFDSGTLTTGTINPGVIYVADKYQVGIEALIPVNRASGNGVGVIAQLHLFLDDIFPNSIGRPLFGSEPRK